MQFHIATDEDKPTTLPWTFICQHSPINWKEIGKTGLLSEHPPTHRDKLCGKSCVSLSLKDFDDIQLANAFHSGFIVSFMKYSDNSPPCLWDKEVKSI